MTLRLLMQDEVDRGLARLLQVAPELPGHRGSICYQIREFGPGLSVLI